MNTLNLILLTFCCMVGAICNSYYKGEEDAFSFIFFTPGLKALSFILVFLPIIISFFANPWWTAMIVFVVGNFTGNTIGRNIVGLYWPSKILPILGIGSFGLFFLLKF